jgi:hypothetical protein
MRYSIKKILANIIEITCYTLNLECPPKSHVLKAWSGAIEAIGKL